MEKVSRFTHITPYNGEYIYYNSARGISSIMVLDCNIRKDSYATLDEASLFYLCQKGHLVDEKIDEDQTIQELQDAFDNRNYLNLIILPNEECNFRCVYCYETLKHRVMDEDTVDSIIRYVENNLSHFESLRVDWFGGEPLLSLDIIVKMSQNFIQICRKHKKSFSASMTTNGYYLDLETFRTLKKCNVTLFQITVDGSREVHDAQRPLSNGKGTYNKIMENLQNIKENVKSGTYKIMLRTNCSSKHLDTFDSYLNDISRVFGDDKRFCVLLRPVMDWGGDRVEQFASEMVGVESLHVFINALMQKRKHIPLLSHAVSLEPLDGVCYAGHKNTIAVDSGGSLFRCTCDFDNNRNSKIGMLRDGECVISNPQQLREWNSNMKHRRSICDACDLLPLCLGDSCPGFRLAGHESHGGCPFEKLFLDDYITMAWEAQQHESRRV